MKTQHRLTIGIFALSIGLILAGIGIFESAQLYWTLKIPLSAGKYLAFAGMGLSGLGIWQVLTLLQDRQRTWRDLVEWAQQESTPAMLLGGACIAIGAIVIGALLWSLASVMQTGSSIAVRPGPIGVGIGMGGMLIWLGSMLLKMAIVGNSSSR